MCYKNTLSTPPVEAAAGEGDGPELPVAALERETEDHDFGLGGNEQLMEEMEEAADSRHGDCFETITEEKEIKLDSLSTVNHSHRSEGHLMHRELTLTSVHWLWAAAKFLVIGVSLLFAVTSAFPSPLTYEYNRPISAYRLSDAVNPFDVVMSRVRISWDELADALGFVASDQVKWRESEGRTETDWLSWKTVLSSIGRIGERAEGGGVTLPAFHLPPSRSSETEPTFDEELAKVAHSKDHSVATQWAKTPHGKTVNAAKVEAPFPLSGSIGFSAYSLHRSTEENYRAFSADFHGKYANIRSRLDYSYHSHYIGSRQLLQDIVIQSMLNRTVVFDRNGNVCSTPVEPWIVFTAGAMGAGKTHTIKHLATKGLFPLESFVAVDPDEIRRHLPEFELYVQHSPQNAGELTRKEAGYVSELLTLAALQDGHNVLVDGSLRDSDWYRTYFEQLRKEYVNLKIAILHVTAPREAVFQRAASRSKMTGRVVPHKTLEMALEQVPKSVQILGPLSDYFCEVHNAGGTRDIQLTTEGQTWESFQNNWVQSCVLDGTPSLPTGRRRDDNIAATTEMNGNGVNPAEKRKLYSKL